MSYRHLLLALDHSPTDPQSADHLLHKAQALAQLHQAQLSVLSVLPPIALAPLLAPDLSFPSVASSPEGVQLALDQETIAREKLQALVAPYGVRAGDVHVAMGVAPAAIVETAEAIGADLVLVGHHQHGWLASLVGSTDQSVVGKSQCDVLTIYLGSPTRP